MLHDEKAVSARARGQEHSHYADVNNWWRAPGTCINGSWRKFRRALKAEREKKEQEQEQEAKAKKEEVEEKKVTEEEEVKVDKP